MSDVLYGKKLKKTVSHTKTSKEEQDQVNFDIGTLTQMQKEYDNVVKLPKMNVKLPVITFNERLIVVQPVINLNAKDLHMDKLSCLKSEWNS